ncbi:phosphoribosylglycinamide formyltransferase [Pisolithus thermaeus]|nr:phosphoribosylglycinamide formyltransferase [Pisolithus thermaeus]
MVLVLSDRKVACGLARATTASPPIPTAYLACQQYLRHNLGKTREDYDLELARIVLWTKPDVVVLAGWMHIVSHFWRFLGGPRGSMKRVKDQRGEVERLGVMVHRVVAEVDMGEPLIVREVPIEKGESIKMYEERLHRVEWETTLQATRKVPDKVRPLLPESMDLA